MERPEPPEDPQPPADLVIRPFRPADRPRLHEIRRAAFAPVLASFRRIMGDEIAALALAREEPDQAALLDRACDGATGAGEGGAAVLVAKVEGEAVGFVSLTMDEARGIGAIDLDAVHPDHAGRGVGARLRAAALDRMRGCGLAVAAPTDGEPGGAPARCAEPPSAAHHRRL